MNKILKFEVDRIELIEEANKFQFAKVKLYAFASGSNAHSRPVSEETLKRSASTIYDKPLVFYYDKYTNDAGGHSQLEVPCGFVQRENNPIEFICLDDGRLMLSVEAMIWKRYSGKILSLFERDGMEKPVSVEIEILEEKENENGDMEIVDMCYMAITILGTFITPAIKSAKAEILEFSSAKKEYSLTFSNSIEIDNSKESAVNGTWSNPHSKLYKPILKADNKESLINEAYLIHEEGYEDTPSSKLKYPHHVIKDDKLILHISGVQSAFSRTEQQGLTGEPIAHIKRHYKELGLNQDNFCIFGLTSKQYSKYFVEENNNKEGDNVIKEAVEKFCLNAQQIQEIISNALSEFTYGENGWRRYYVNTFDDVYAYVEDCEIGKTFRMKYLIVDNVATVDVESKEEVIRGNYMPVGEVGEDEATEVNENEGTEEMSDMKDMPEMKEMSSDLNTEATAQAELNENEAEKNKELTDEGKEENFKAKFEEMSEKYSKLEADMAVYMTENEKLKKFKADVEEKTMMAKVEYAIQDVMEYVPKEKIEELKEDSKNFSIDTIGVWENKVKAEAFSFTKGKEKKEDFIKMALPFEAKDDKKSDSLWDRV